MLMKYSEENTFQVEILEKILISDIFREEESTEEIGSTGIRKEISCGCIERANAMMGRCFQVRGEVIYGNQLGYTVFDMPTANIKWPENKVFPAFGVYFTEVIADGTAYAAITNVGKKPTIDDSEQVPVLAESYLYDFSGNLYGKEITVVFYAFSRPEQKFENMEALKEQLQKDMHAGRAYWSAR